MSAIKKVIETASSWVGYLEKKSNKDLDDFTANAGSNNYTCFARDYKVHTGGNYQAQPWCAMFVSEVLVQTFGVEKARKLLCGELYHYCPTGVNQFKAGGRWNKSPEPGDIIFFTNGSRAYHTGIVTQVTSGRVKTIEGNTSGASGVIANGGGVCEKSYSLVDSKIMGYGRPDYSIAEQKPGWVKDNIGYRYRRPDGTSPVNQWCVINHHWYLFNRDGYMCTGWHRWNGHVCDPEDGSGDWYFLDDTKDGALEGACWHTKENGAQEIWYVMQENAI